MDNDDDTILSIPEDQLTEAQKRDLAEHKAALEKFRGKIPTPRKGANDTGSRTLEDQVEAVLAKARERGLDV